MPSLEEFKAMSQEERFEAMRQREADEHAAKMERIEAIKANNRASMQGRCYECGGAVTTGNYIESGNQRYCFSCAAKGADLE